jgi:hypothetical protein
MCTPYDPQHEAEAAMKRAAASEGPDRQRLIELALAWHQLARDRREASGRADFCLTEETARFGPGRRP